MVFSLKKSFGVSGFLSIYHGAVIEKNKAELREKQYIKDKLGCYQYFFLFRESERGKFICAKL